MTIKFNMKQYLAGDCAAPEKISLLLSSIEDRHTALKDKVFYDKDIDFKELMQIFNGDTTQIRIPKFMEQEGY